MESDETISFYSGLKTKTLDSEGIKFPEKSRCCLIVDLQKSQIDLSPDTLYTPVSTDDSMRILISISSSEKSIFL